MKKLVIKYLGGKEDEIASVTQTESGKLLVSSSFPELLPELEEIVHKYEGQTLTLTGAGDVKSDPNDLTPRVCATVVSKIPPGDPRYLSAMWDSFNHDDPRVQGKRLHCWTVDI